MKRCVFIALAVLTAACAGLEEGLTPFTPREAEELFSGKSELGVYDGGVKVWEFERTRHQLILTRNLDPERDLIRFTIQSDDLSRILSVTFPRIFSEGGALLIPVGAEVEISVAAKGIGQISEGTKRAKVSKVQNDANRQGVWLWDNDGQQGYMLLTEL